MQERAKEQPIIEEYINTEKSMLDAFVKVLNDDQYKKFMEFLVANGQQEMHDKLMAMANLAQEIKEKFAIPLQYTESKQINYDENSRVSYINHVLNEKYLEKLNQLALIGKEFIEQYRNDYNLLAYKFQPENDPTGQLNSEIDGLPIKSIQRSPRIELLMNEVLKYAEVDSDTYEAAKRASVRIKEFNHVLNSTIVEARDNKIAVAQAGHLIEDLKQFIKNNNGDKDQKNNVIKANELVDKLKDDIITDNTQTLSAEKMLAKMKEILSWRHKKNPTELDTVILKNMKEFNEIANFERYRNQLQKKEGHDDVLKKARDDVTLLVVNAILSGNIPSIVNDKVGDNKGVVREHLNAIAGGEYLNDFIQNIAGKLTNEDLFQLTKAMMVLFNESSQSENTNMLRQASLAGSLYKEYAKRMKYQPPAPSKEFDELNALYLQNVKKMPSICKGLHNDEKKIEVATNGMILFAIRSLYANNREGFTADQCEDHAINVKMVGQGTTEGMDEVYLAGIEKIKKMPGFKQEDVKQNLSGEYTDIHRAMMKNEMVKPAPKPTIESADIEKVVIRRQESIILNNNNAPQPAKLPQRVSEVSAADINQTLNNHPAEVKSIRELYNTVLTVKAKNMVESSKNTHPNTAASIKSFNMSEFGKAVKPLLDVVDGKSNNSNHIKHIEEAVARIGWLKTGRDYGDAKTASDYNQLLESFIKLTENIAAKFPDKADKINKIILPMKIEHQFNKILNVQFHEPAQTAHAKILAKQFAKLQIWPDLDAPKYKELKEFLVELNQQKPEACKQLLDLMHERGIDIKVDQRPIDNQPIQPQVMEAVVMNEQLPPSVQKTDMLMDVVDSLKDLNNNDKAKGELGALRHSKSLSELIKAIESKNPDAIYNVAKAAYDKRNDAGLFARTFKFDKESSQHYQALCKVIIDNIKNDQVNADAFKGQLDVPLKSFTELEKKYKDDRSSITMRK